MKKTIAAVVMSAVAAVGSANAAIVFGNLGNSGTDGLDSAGSGLTDETWFAIGFQPTTPSIYFNTATIGLAGSGNIELALYSDNFGSPGTLLASDTQLVSSTVSTRTSFSFKNPLSFTLTSNENYWLVGRAVTGSATWVFADSEANNAGLNSSGWTATGSLRSTDVGNSWTSRSSALKNSLSIDATTTPIPEPGTWAAMAILAGGAAFAGWRRRQQQLA
jgi:hypothetical protein